MKRILFGLSVLLIASLTAACDGNGGGQTSTASGGSAGTGGGGTGGTGGGGTAGTGGSNTGGSNTGGSSTGGSGGGAMCGGIAGIQCAENQFCDFPDDMCGAADGAGTCAPRPDACDKVLDPKCACDGKVYDNACEAQKAGADIGTLGGCPAPAGQFPCGAGFCAKGQQYCQVDVSDVGGIPNGYGCKPLPADCSQAGATCDCLAGQPCGNMCQQVDGGFVVTCPGG